MNLDHLSREKIYLWIDERLSPAEQRQVKAHLQECLVCQRRVARAATLKTALRQRLGGEPAPGSLQATVQARLRVADSLNHDRRPRLWLGLAVAAILLALGGVSVWWGVSTVGRPSTLHLVEAHSQAEQQNRLATGENEISGDDLSRQLGWPAPVPAGEGLSVLSGRVDQLDGQPIAHLLYRLKDGAAMSLFMWQGPLPFGVKLAPRPYEGKTVYVGQLGDEAIVLWPQGGRVYACVSSTDLERLLEAAGDVWDAVSSLPDGPPS